MSPLGKKFDLTFKLVKKEGRDEEYTLLRGATRERLYSLYTTLSFLFWGVVFLASAVYFIIAIFISETLYLDTLQLVEFYIGYPLLLLATLAFLGFGTTMVINRIRAVNYRFDSVGLEIQKIRGSDPEKYRAIIERIPRKYFQKFDIIMLRKITRFPAYKFKLKLVLYLQDYEKKRITINLWRYFKKQVKKENKDKLIENKRIGIDEFIIHLDKPIYPVAKIAQEIAEFLSKEYGRPVHLKMITDYYKDEERIEQLVYSKGKKPEGTVNETGVEKTLKQYSNWLEKVD